MTANRSRGAPVPPPPWRTSVLNTPQCEGTLPRRGALAHYEKTSQNQGSDRKGQEQNEGQDKRESRLEGAKQAQACRGGGREARSSTRRADNRRHGAQADQAEQADVLLLAAR